ncbi:MAG: M20/M25/M40 family metallo-hydrolase [Thermoleophilia bacterium]
MIAAMDQAQTLLKYFNGDNEFAHLAELASDKYQGRKSGTAGAEAAAAYITTQFDSLGLSPWAEIGLSSYRQSFYSRGISGDNVIGVIPGSGDGYIILGAHYDHLGVNANSQVYNGADDNAAGVAAVLETARLIHQSGMRPGKTIVFCAFSGEEEGEIGAGSLGNLIASNGLDHVTEMINIDGIGATGGDYFGVWDEGASNTGPLVAALKQAGAALNTVVREEGTDIGSDAQPFDWQFGIPAVTVDWNWGQDESTFHPYYHTINDETQYIDRNVLERATRLAVAGLWLRAADSS